MTTRRRKSSTLQFLERRTGGPLTLGSLLEAIRLGDEISQAAFARKFGISRPHLSDIVHGRKSVSLPRALEFAKALGYPQDQFVRLALQAMVEEAGLNMQIPWLLQPTQDLLPGQLGLVCNSFGYNERSRRRKQKVQSVDLG